MVELGTFARHVVGIEHRAEDALHIADVFADRDFRAGLELDIGRARQMVGVRVGLQHNADLDAEFAGLRQQRVGGGEGRLAAAEIVIEHRIDHRAFFGLRVPDQIAHGIGGLVEKRPDFGLNWVFAAADMDDAPFCTALDLTYILAIY